MITKIILSCGILITIGFVFYLLGQIVGLMDIWKGR